MSLARTFTFLMIVIASISTLPGRVFAQNSAKPTPSIILEYHGFSRESSGTEFELSLFLDGTVLFDGRNRTRTVGIAGAMVEKTKVQQWLDTLVKDDALTRSDYPLMYDVPWYRLTVNAEGRRASFRFNGQNTLSPTVKVIQDIFSETQVFDRWVV